MTALALAALLLAALPALVAARNLRLVSPPDGPRPATPPRVTLCIPARDEEGTIGAAVEAALRSRDVELELLVLDDRSRDRTAGVALEVARGDARLRVLQGVEPPPGASGKAWACAALARAASSPWLVFQDADVTLEPDALARLVAALEAQGADLVSGVPRQVTVGLVERLLVPLIDVVLLGYLPVWRMRRSGHPAYAAGCGQLVAVRHAAYERAGGHGAIPRALNDGVALPRALRAAGLRTDLIDAAPIARCRMFRSAREACAGLMRTAPEGLATPRMILPATALLLGGHVLPFALASALPLLELVPATLAASAATVALATRVAIGRRGGARLADALLHPLGVTLLVGLQWAALVRRLAGAGPSWRGRRYDARASAAAS